MKVADLIEALDENSIATWNDLLDGQRRLTVASLRFSEAQHLAHRDVYPAEEAELAAGVAEARYAIEREEVEREAG